MPEEQSFIQLIGNFGFPIVITMYLLHRFEKKIEGLEAAIHTLAKVIDPPKKEYKNE
ncbi:YvrJ family protein [Cytobacillus sp. S13-E01]|uniref:YvrJ family protein n=1 Tax=Cytobacillus sp. S13-E01 TaxID=3031326 RepID=UPI0023D84574|nr:YvrJ family protein [Cytobacillus sp. S13-E01]MDF0725780.1 YvrJ family protein [Cytobacillus sp. S13-E01]